MAIVNGHRYPLHELSDLGWLLRERVSEALSSSKDTHAALNSALRSLMDDEVGDQATIQVRDELIGSLVFLVANYVPLSVGAADGHRRCSTAILFRDRLRHPILQQSPQRLTKWDCAVLFVGGNADPVADSALEAVWGDNWQEYGQLTAEGIQRNFYTWNQFLLDRVRRPDTIGLSRADHDSTSSSYIHVADWLRESGHSLPLRSLSQPPNRWAEAAEATRIASAWRRMRPLDPNEADASHAAWAGFHLLRSFGDWGGDAFVSIPYVFGSSPEDAGACVLSLCTDSALDDEMIARWRYLGREMFQPLVSSQTRAVLLRSVEQLEHSAGAYGIAHAMKHRAGPLVEDLRRLKERIDAGTATTDPELQEYLMWAIQRATSLGRLSLLLNAIDSAVRQGPENITKQDLLSVGSLDVHAALDNLVKIVQPTSIDRTFRRPNIQVHGQALTVHPFLSHCSGRLVRPSDEIYLETAYEVVTNALNHGLIERGSVYVDVNVGACVAVSNKCNEDDYRILREKLRATNVNTDWISWPPPQTEAGGLFYAAQALRVTKAGSLWLRARDESDEHWCDVQIRLEGTLLHS